MRSSWLVAFVVVSCGCAATRPPAPAVAVVRPAIGAGIATERATVESDEQTSEDEDEDDAFGERWVAPCKERSLEQRVATAELGRLDAHARALDPRADPTPVVEELERLLEHPCFALAAADPKEPLAFASAVSFTHWWKNGGGDWLRDYLHAEDRRVVALPPTPRIALTSETAPKDHPLAPLLCPSTSTSCGLDASGWTLRAERALRAKAREPDDDYVKCRDEARKEGKANERYAAFRDCVEQERVRTRALPVGRLRAPVDGWFVFADEERGCRALRAYDLATGSAYSVDEGCGRGPAKVSIGRVPVAALREAAWMTMLAAETQANVGESHRVSVPDEIRIGRPGGELVSIGSFHCSCGPSESHAWSWLRERRGVLRGQVSGRFGHFDDEALGHAKELWDVAESAREDGCAPAAPPARVAWSAPGPASKDHDAAVLDDASTEGMRLALARARPSSRACTPKP